MCGWAGAIWRRGGLRTEFLQRVHVTINGRLCTLDELLNYHRDLAAELHQQDRVHTYGSFYIADIAA
jgi:S-adenosylmethionine-diacylglycerol 3-amino-3-carboxypropyl transferase